MHRIKKSVSGDLTMIRPLIPLSPNVLSAWIACKIIRVSASSCVQYNSWQSETPSLQIFLAMIRSTRKIRTSADDISRHDKQLCCTIDSPRNFINACLLAATARNLFQSGIGRPSMKLSHFRTYNVSCRIGPCIRNT